MSNLIRFGATQLVGTGKRGILKPDADGYYELTIGALDVYNSVGQFYAYEPAKALFEGSSSLMRRISRGALRGEYGHPKQLPGQTIDQYANRILSIYEENVCCHFKEIRLELNKAKDDAGRPIVLIIAKLKPSGPKGPALKESLDNPDENVCFSIRSFTDDQYIGGRTVRYLKTIVTWDYVNEPGIAVAEKYKSMGLESLIEETVSRRQMTKGLEELKAMAIEQSKRGIAVPAMESLVTADELFKSLGWNDSNSAPGWSRW